MLEGVAELGGLNRGRDLKAMPHLPARDSPYGRLVEILGAQIIRRVTTIEIGDRKGQTSRAITLISCLNGRAVY